MTPWEIHPALVHFPIAFLLGAVAVDLYARLKPGESLTRVAAGLYVAGTAGGVPAILAGLVAFFTVPHAGGRAHDLMYWHPGVSAASLGLFAAVAVRRWRLRSAPARTGAFVLALLASALLAAGGFLGGYMVYHLGVGVSRKMPEGPGHGPGTQKAHPAGSPASDGSQELPAK